MLPNWLYGKSKSKLASILGGGGGIPEDYNQVKAQVTQNTEDILLLSDALDGKVALTQITNPNLLHNPWFQVNQRGATTISSGGYFVDRWRVSTPSSGSATCTLNSDGTITIDNSLGEGNVYFAQKRAAKTISRVAARKVTLSIMLSDGTIHSGTEAYSGTETTTYYNDENFVIQSSPQSGQFFTLRVKAGKTITIKALKLELGEVSTLAMDTAPDMATELIKCQRYYVRLKNSDNGTPLAFGYLFQGSSRVTCPLAVPMINKPNFTFTTSASGGPTFVLASGDVATDISKFTIDTDDMHQRIIFLYPNVTAGTSELAMLRLNAGVGVEFDAEL